MAKFHYQVDIDSPTGEKLTRFLRQCFKCEEAAEDYAKKMGAVTYYEDPRYFAGGVVCIAFAEGVRIDRGVWREAGVDRSDGVTYWEPNCQERRGWAEVPSRDYALRDTFDRIYDRSRIQEREVPVESVEPVAVPQQHTEQTGQTAEGKPLTERRLFVPYVEFFRAEPSGHSGSSPSGERTASRGLRKAIKAEVRRQRLPVMRTESLLAILGATVAPVEPVAVAQQHTEQPATPTLFAFHSRYFIGCDYDSSANHDLLPISLEMYKMNRDKAEMESKRGWS